MADPTTDQWAAFNLQPDPSATPTATPAATPSATPAVTGGPQSVTVGTPHPKQPSPHELPAAPQPALTPQEKAQHNLPPNAPYFWGPDGIPTLPTGYKDPTDPESNVAQKQQALDATHDLIQSIEKARGYVNDANNPVVGNTATGLGYNLLSHSPVPTDASALSTTIKGEIQGNIFKNWMASMKAATEKGGSAFGGRIMQSEIPFIVNSLGALTPGSLTRDQFLGNLDQVEGRVLRSAALLNGENPDDPNVIAKYKQQFLPPPPKTNNNTTPPGAPTSGTAPQGPGGGGNGPNGGGNGPQGGLQLSPEQQAKEKAFIATNPSTQQYAAFLGALQGGGTVDENAAAARLKALQTGANYNPSIGHSLGVGVGGVAQGVGDIANMVSTPFVNGVNDLFGTHFNPDMGANLRAVLGTPDPQNMGERIASTINEYGTQALGLANAAKLAAERVPGIVGNALSAIAERPLTDSSAASAGGGASQTTKEAGGGPLAQTAAGLVAAVPVAAIAGKANALATGIQNVPSVVSAGQQEGVNVPRAMAFKSLQPDVIASGKTMAGAKIMGPQMAQVGNQIQARTNALGQGGDALDNYLLGEKAQGIGTRYIRTSGADFNQKYSALRTASGGIKIPADTALQKIDGILGTLNKAPETNQAEIVQLQKWRNDLANGLDVESARDMGSKISKTIQKGDVTFGKSEADVLGIKNAISQDIASGLQNAGLSGVARSFKQVDGEYQQRMDFIHNVVQALTGPRQSPLPAETAASRIMSWTQNKGNSVAFQRIMAQATPEERSDIAATFAQSLGSDGKGGFSTAKLVTNAAKMSDRAKQIAFGPDGAQSLNNLVQLAQEHARVTGALGGSPTALATDARTWAKRVLFGALATGGEAASGAGALHSAIAGAGVAAGLTGAKMAKDVFSAQALMSPKITGWLKSAPRSSDPAAINQWYNRLKVIAVREPALAPEIQKIQSGLMSAANSNVTPAVAASGTDQGNQ